MRHILLFVVLAVVFAVICGCNQQENITSAVDPAFEQAAPRTVAMLPIGRMDMVKLTVPQQQAAYAKIADKLQRAFPDATIIAPADAAARLKGDGAANPLDELDAAYRQNNLPSSELIAGISKSLGADAFLYGSVSTLGEKVDVENYKGTLRIGLQFALYAAAEGSTKVLWTSDGQATVDVTLHQPADRAALFLKGIDLLFGSLPNPRTQPTLRVPGTPVSL